MNKIEEVVLPLKEDAIKYAEQRANELVEKVKVALEEADFDAQVVAPYPSSLHDSREGYHRKLARYNRVRSLTVSDKQRNPYCRGMKDPEYVVMNAERIEHFVEMFRDAAAQQYDAFVAKLNGKIGEDVVEARLEGNHVWGHSILYITRSDGNVEKWKTQTVHKLSKLGKPFFQYPTRKLKK